MREKLIILFWALWLFLFILFSNINWSHAAPPFGGINFSSSPVSPEKKIETRKELVEYISYLKEVDLYDSLFIDHYNKMFALGEKLNVKVPPQTLEITPTDDIYLLLNQEQAIKYGKEVWKSPEGVNALRYKIKLLEKEINSYHKDKSIYSSDIFKVTDTLRLYDLALGIAEYHQQQFNDVGMTQHAYSIPVRVVAE